MLKLLLLLLVSGTSSVAFTQDIPTCAPQVVENRNSPLSLNGDPGMWFHLEVSRCMLGRLTALPRLQNQIDLLEARLTLGLHQAANLESRLLLLSQERDLLAEQLGSAVTRAREAESELGAWYRNPFLWTGVGVVLAIVAVIVLFQIPGIGT